MTIQAMILLYNTRDGKGNDIVKPVELKEAALEPYDGTCGLCGKAITQGARIKNLVSANFTDWPYVSGDYVCESCIKLLSLYFYSYIVSGEDILLFNVREMAEEIQKPQKPPFKIIISKSQKKHLFYKAAWNDNPEKFTVNLEEEQISTSLDEQRTLFAFVSALITLGESKQNLSSGSISLGLYAKTGYNLGRKIYEYLTSKLCRRDIQIPLFIAQKMERTDEECITILKQTI